MYPSSVGGFHLQICVTAEQVDEAVAGAIELVSGENALKTSLCVQGED
jgi:hypothetical protein